MKLPSSITKTFYQNTPRDYSYSNQDNHMPIRSFVTNLRLNISNSLLFVCLTCTLVNVTIPALHNNSLSSTVIYNTQLSNAIDIVATNGDFNRLEPLVYNIITRLPTSSKSLHPTTGRCKNLSVTSLDGITMRFASSAIDSLSLSQTRVDRVPNRTSCETNIPKLFTVDTSEG